MGGHDHILPKDDLIFVFVVETYEKSGFAKQSFLQKNTKCQIHQQETREGHAKHVLEMSIKLRFQCERFKKKQCFALMVLNWFPICFY